MRAILFFTLLFSWNLILGQNTKTFPEKVEGNWSGTMYIFDKNIIKDSVNVNFTVRSIPDTSDFVWKTEYLSENKLVKDYVLRLVDTTAQTYSIDEGQDVVLSMQVFGNKLVGLFDVKGFLIFTQYELVNDQLIFEVTSGVLESTNEEIKDNMMLGYQKVVLKRIQTKD